MVALCLAVNGYHANEAYDDYYHNGSEYGDWTEITDGTKKTVRELATEAGRSALNVPGKIMNKLGSTASEYMKRSGTGGFVTIAPRSGPLGNGAPLGNVTESNENKSGSQIPTDTARVNPKEQAIDSSVKKLASDDSLSANKEERKHNVFSDASTETFPYDTPESNGTNGTIGAKTQDGVQTPGPKEKSKPDSKPKRKRKNSEDKYQMYIGYRMSTEKKNQRDHTKLCDIGHWTRTLLQGDEDVKAYYSDRGVSKNNNGTPTVLHVEYQGVTAEMLCLWNHLQVKVSTQESRSYRYAMYQSEEPETSMQLDMVSEYTLLYTNRRSNRIVLIYNKEVVRVAEVLVSVGKDFKPRVVLYTDSCLRLTDGVNIIGISKSKVEKEMRILIFCLLIVTGWGLYTNANQTTEISFANSDNSTPDWTVSVTQGENPFTMFDTNTEFMFTDTGGSSGQAKPNKEGAAASPTELRDSSKSAKSESTGSLSSQKVGQIVTRAAKAQQAIQATHNMKLRTKQNVESSKADEAPDTAKQAGETAKKKTGEASNKKAANNASDTSSSDEAIAHHTRSKTLEMPEQLAEKNKRNKSK